MKACYSVRMEMGIPTKGVRLIKVCINEIYSRVQVAEHLSRVFPIKNGLMEGDAFLTLLFNFVLECVIRRFYVNQKGLKLNDMHINF